MSYPRELGVPPVPYVWFVVVDVMVEIVSVVPSPQSIKIFPVAPLVKVVAIAAKELAALLIKNLTSPAVSVMVSQSAGLTQGPGVGIGRSREVDVWFAI